MSATIEVRQRFSLDMHLQSSYRLTAEDYRQAQRQHSGAYGRMLQVTGVLLILSAVPAFLAQQYLAMLPAIVVGSLLAFGIRFQTSYGFRKESALHLETSVAISDSGLVFTNSSGEGRMQWGAFIRYAETKNAFVLYVQTRIFYIIPKRCFSQEELTAVRALFDRHIGGGPSSRSVGVKVFVLSFVSVAAAVLVYFAVRAIQR